MVKFRILYPGQNLMNYFPYVGFVLAALASVRFVSSAALIENMLGFVAKKGNVAFSKEYCDHVYAVKKYHAELFDPTTMSFIGAFCPEIKSNTYELFIYFLSVIQSSDNNFDCPSVESWEGMINKSFKSFASFSDHLSQNFINSVVVPNSRILKSIDYKFSINKYKEDADNEILKYMKKDTVKGIQMKLQEILSNENKNEAQIYFKMFLNDLISEFTKLNEELDASFKLLFEIPIEKVPSNFDLQDVSIDEVIINLAKAVEKEMNLMDKLKFSPIKLSKRVDLVLDCCNLDSDDEHHIIFDSLTIKPGMRPDFNISNKRRSSYGNQIRLGPFNLLNWKPEKLKNLFLKNSNNLFSVNFGQSKIIDFLLESQSKHAKLLFDFICLNYRPHNLKTGDSLMFSSYPSAVHEIGDLRKPFINSLIYTAFIEFSLVFPEQAEIICQDLGISNPGLLSSTIDVSKAFLNPENCPYQLLPRLAKWGHEITFKLFSSHFKATNSIEFIQKSLIKAVRGGKPNIVQYVVDMYREVKHIDINEALIEAIKSTRNEIISILIESDFEIKKDNLATLCKNAVAIEQESFVLIALKHGLNADDLLHYAMPFAYSLKRNDFLRFLLDIWFNEISSKSELIHEFEFNQVTIYAKELGYLEFSELLKNNLSEYSDALTLKKLVQMNDERIFDIYFNSLNSLDSCDIAEALKAVKSHKIVNKILTKFSETQLEAEVAAKIITNIIKYWTNDFFFDESIGIDKLLILISQRKTSDFEDEQVLEIFKEAIRKEFYDIYHFFTLINLKISQKLFREMKLWATLKIRNVEKREFITNRLTPLIISNDESNSSSNVGLEVFEETVKEVMSENDLFAQMELLIFAKDIKYAWILLKYAKIYKKTEMMNKLYTSHPALSLSITRAFKSEN